VISITNLDACALLELAVFVLQVVGVLGVCLCRLLPGSAWARRGRAALVLVLLGLAAAGAALGTHDSEFALFAGGTITLLLIGITLGSGAQEPSEPPTGAIVIDAC
jgi:hypothetical protein